MRSVLRFPRRVRRVETVKSAPAACPSTLPEDAPVRRVEALTEYRQELRRFIGDTLATMHAAEMAMFERTSTKTVARPMLMPLMAEVVVARVGHIPSRRENVGFSFTKPLVIS